MATENALSARQARFVTEYLVDLNATQAAIRAGYSPTSAHVTGSQLIRHYKVAAAIAKGQSAVVSRLEVTVEDIVRRAWEIANEDRGDRTAALALLAKRHPEFSEKHEVKAEIDVVERLYVGVRVDQV
jgi:phage terminase small subunit